jgi:hypothetical protein
MSRSVPIKHTQMSFVSNGGKFKLYTVLNGFIFPTPTHPRTSLNARYYQDQKVKKKFTNAVATTVGIVLNKNVIQMLKIKICNFLHWFQFAKVYKMQFLCILTICRISLQIRLFLFNVPAHPTFFNFF